jgi:hypothetical protein
MGSVRASTASWIDANTMNTRVRSSVLASIQQAKILQRVQPTVQSVRIEGRLPRDFAYTESLSAMADVSSDNKLWPAAIPSPGGNY